MIYQFHPHLAEPCLLVGVSIFKTIIENIHIHFIHYHQPVLCFEQQ